VRLLTARGWRRRLRQTASGAVRRHDFTGIHVAAPTLLHDLPEVPVFSIVSYYLQLARSGGIIGVYEQPGAQRRTDVVTKNIRSSWLSVDLRASA
jgi:hypothetical protein